MAILADLKNNLLVSFLIEVLGFGITVPSAIDGDISIDLAAKVVPSRNQLTWQRRVRYGPLRVRPWQLGCHAHDHSSRRCSEPRGYLEVPAPSSRGLAKPSAGPKLLGA